MWWLSQPVDPKAKTLLSRKEHYEYLAKQGINDPLGEVPKFPYRMEYIWNWFNELRGVTGDNLSPSNVFAFFQLKRIEPTENEVTTINRLYIALQNETAEAMRARV